MGLGGRLGGQRILRQPPKIKKTVKNGYMGGFGGGFGGRFGGQRIIRQPPKSMLGCLVCLLGVVLSYGMLCGL